MNALEPGLGQQDGHKINDDDDFMNALVLARFGTMAVQRRPRPFAATGDVLLRTIATGICGSDLHGYTGENGRRALGQIMGHESVATVVRYGDSDSKTRRPAIGAIVTFNPTIACGHCSACLSGLTHICAERRVIGVDPSISSAFAEFVVVPAANIVELPPGMPAEHGALVEPLAVGYHAAVRGSVTEGSAVLVIGAGPIGQSAILASLRLHAATVFVSEPNNARRTVAKQLGAIPLESDHAVEQVLAATNGVGVDVAIDAVGLASTVDNALNATRRGGNTVLVGMNGTRLDIDAYRVSTDERALIGAFCYSSDEFVDTVHWASTASDALDQLISSRVCLLDGPDAFRRLAEGGEGQSKILVVFDQH